ncbi:MAG: PhzF family phenazine biosynthesis protein [Mobilicoccus sp.]|nr:PhzF family phenazine biosynthesis protein [Mobilicoccus sp.]
MELRFTQVDVFSSEPFKGNPVAVVHDADDLPEDTMAAFARWTNLSETTFLLSPTTPDADYRLRIFTPGGELPFAGHPTLGSACAWLEAGGAPRTNGVVVQECGAGLVKIRDEERLAFAAPPLTRSGPVDAGTLETVRDALGLAPDQVRDAAWVDNGPGWTGLVLDHARTVLDLRPDVAALGDHRVGVIGRHDESSAPADSPEVEVRAFAHGLGVDEDPVTGSLNSGFALWLIEAGVLPDSYVAAQGAALGRAGRVHVSRVDGQVWVGGDAVTRVHGTLIV